VAIIADAPRAQAMAIGRTREANRSLMGDLRFWGFDIDPAGVCAGRAGDRNKLS
jgi:hypothetical protein